MKKITIAMLAVVSTFSLNVFAATDIEANSYVKCVEAKTLSAAVVEVNTLVTVSAFRNSLNPNEPSYIYVHMKNYTSSQPSVTQLSNGNIAMCVTLTKK